MEQKPQDVARPPKLVVWLGAACQVLGACVLLILLVHWGVGAYDGYRARFTEDAIDGEGRHHAPLYAGFPAEEFWREHSRAFSTRFQPYYHWRRNPFPGTYTHVDEQGVRRTLKTPAPNAKKIFVMGGSSVWGTGVADGDTLPSQLQQLLGSGYDVYNFGESGWVSTQSLHYLMHRLAQGDTPHAVIFSWFYWQPNLLSLTKPLHPFEADIVKAKSKVRIEAQRQGYLAAKQRLSGREAEGIHFLGDLFNDVADNLYIDQTHVGAAGNRLIAAEMHRRLAAVLDGGAAAGPSSQVAIP